MSRRIEIELTSTRDDGSVTWRAAGAREPKGTIDAALLPGDAKVGDVLRVEAEFYIEGIEITSVVGAKPERQEPERIELLGSGDSHPAVTTTLVGRRGGRGRDDDRDGGPRSRRDGGRRDGGGRGDGGRREGAGRGGARSDGGRGDAGRERPPGGRGRAAGERGPGADRGSRQRPERGPRPARQQEPVKPKAKRLRPRRTHRDAALAALPQIQHPLANEVMRGGIPGLRKLIDEQNAEHRAAGRPEIDPNPLLELGESLLPRLKAAEWHDRAEAALAGIDEVDLRDLRSVVVAAESAARSEETRALADQLREALTKRVDDEHNAWLADIASALTDDRTVRALRMSSRPPKAGAPMPPDLATRLAEAAAAALTADTGPQRWGTVLDAIAFSPVRQTVQPQAIPSTVNDELLDTVRRLSSRVPQIAALFGIEPTEPPRKRRRAGGGGTRRGAEGSPS